MSEIINLIVTDNPTREAFENLYQEAKNPTAQQLSDDLFYRSTWQQAFEWATKQCEEYFCDLVGMRIFGESFLHAFAYLLRPSFQGERPVEYPNYRRRIANQIEAAKRYEITVPDGYLDWFSDMTEPSQYETLKTFLLSLADRAADRLCADLVEHVDIMLAYPEEADEKDTNVNADSECKREEMELVDRLAKEFKEGAPPENAGALAPLLNAAWRVLLADEPLIGIPGDRKEDVMRELLLKSMEVLEYETRIAEDYAPKG